MTDTEHLLEEGDKTQTQSEYSTILGEKEKGEGSTTFGIAIFNLVNTIIGSGFLTLPYNLMLNGWVIGTMMLIAFAVLTMLSMWQLIDVSTETHCYQYYAIARKMFQSPAWGIIISCIMIVQTSGSLISYAIIIQQDFYWWNKKDDFAFIQLTFWAFMLLLIYPLASLKKLDFLHWTSYVTLIVVVYIAIMTVSYFGQGLFHPQPPIAFKVPTVKSLTTLPLFQNAYCCHYQIANIYRDLKAKSEKKMRKVVSINMIIVFALYGFIALFGYFTFTQQLELNSNLLDVFNHLAGDLWYVQASNYMMLIAMISHYPLPCFGLRRTIESLFWKDQDSPVVWRFLICLIIIGVTGIIGSFVNNISDVLGYTSSLAGSCVVFIFPSLFSFMVWRRQGGKVRLIGSIVGGTVGLFVMVTGLVCSIISGTTGH